MSDSAVTTTERDPNDPSGPDTPRELKARALRLLMRREPGREDLVRRLASHAESMEAL